MSADAEATVGGAAGAESAPRAPDARAFALLGALSSGAAIAASVVRSKVTAHAVGPAGLGVVAEVTQLTALTTTIASVSTGPVLLSWVAEAHASGDRARVVRGLASSTLVALALALAGTLVAVAAAPAVLPAVAHARTFTVFAGLALTFGAASAALQGVFTGTADLRTTTLATLATSVTGAAAVVGLTLAFGLTGQFVALPVGAALGLAVSLVLARRAGWFVRPRWDAEFARRAFVTGATTLVAAVISQAVTSSVRVFLARAGGAQLGSTYNGNYQAASQIGTQYFTLVLGSLAAYFAPRFAAAREGAPLRDEVREAERFVLRVAPPLIIAAITLRGPAIAALYSHRFELATVMLGPLLAADVVRAFSWASAAPLLFRGRLRWFLATEVVGGVLSIAAHAWFVARFGPSSVGYAAALTFALYSAVCAFALREACNVPPSWRRVASAWALTALALAVDAVTSRWPSSRWGILPTVAVWVWRLGAADYARSQLRRVRTLLARLRGAPPINPRGPRSCS